MEAAVYVHGKRGTYTYSIMALYREYRFKSYRSPHVLKGKSMTDKKLALFKSILNVQQMAPIIDKSQDNPFFKSKYADLPAVWKSIKKLMLDNGLLVNHVMGYEDGNDFILTKIVHVESGEYEESRSKIYLTKATAQEYGSYVTYMRRYALSAMLGLVTDEDDDGNNASNKKPEAKPEGKPSPLVEQCRKIKSEIESCESEELLNQYMEEQKSILEDIKSKNENNYKSLMATYDAQLKKVEKNGK